MPMPGNGEVLMTVTSDRLSASMGAVCASEWTGCQSKHAMDAAKGSKVNRKVFIKQILQAVLTKVFIFALRQF
jgi:hypothetical protein